MNLSQMRYAELTQEQRLAKSLGFEFMPDLEELQAAAFDKTKNELIDAVAQHLDITAQSKGYGDRGKTPMAAITSIISYENDTDPKFAQEAQTFKLWRSQVWTYCYLQLTRVQAAERTIPTTDELIAELPQIVWPN